jgi:ribosomal protein S18 acetylase RimI-like enzyme
MNAAATIRMCFKVIRPVMLGTFCQQGRRRDLLLRPASSTIRAIKSNTKVEIMDYVIHPLSAADEPVLWEMLYQALRTSQDAPPRDIVRRPEYARHVEGWGRAGDSGFVAYDAEQKDDLLGAAWFRLSPVESGEKAVPELAFAVKSGHRKRGIGAALLTQLVKANPQYNAVLMSAGANNPAVRLYERFGFKIVQQSERAVTLRREV